MTSLPLEPAGKAADAFVDAGAEILRQRPHPHGPRGPRKPHWAQSVLKTLLHAAIAAAAVVWSLRGYLDRADEERAETQRRLTDLEHAVQHVSDRIDELADKR